MPQNADDSIVVSLFNQHWPAEPALCRYRLIVSARRSPSDVAPGVRVNGGMRPNRDEHGGAEWRPPTGRWQAEDGRAMLAALAASGQTPSEFARAKDSGRTRELLAHETR